MSMVSPRLSPKFLAAADVGIFFVIGFLLGFLRPDIVFPLVFLLLFPYLVVSGRGGLVRYHVVAAICSLVWMLIGGGIYGYRDLYFSIGYVSIYPLAAWAVGFTLAYLVSMHVLPKRKGFWIRFVVYTVVYWVFVIAYETIAYHVFEIRNPATSDYPGLPLCDCIHAPVWVQVTYLSMGPVFYLICRLPFIRKD